jgi:eukaryotic-like serine/threonine-protein kinase
VGGETRDPVESPHTLVQPSRPPPIPARRRFGGGGERPDAADLVLDRYRLLERLGTGGFGVVWRAHDELLHREVAVKRVRLGPDGDRERAEREALAAARLSHPAIVALHEACAVDDAFYLISELVEGETLARLIAQRAIEDEDVLEIGLALAGALAHAHARGVIHRDIKPQNVLVPSCVEAGAASPELLVAAKLTDFGGASLAGEDALTRTGDVLGTLAYMAPEQSEGREVGVQADLYSLALVLYEALCGVNPVRGATPAATVRRIGRRLQPLERMRRDLPLGLTRDLDRALAPAPGERGTLEDLRTALEEALGRGLARPRRRAPRPRAGKVAPSEPPLAPAPALAPRPRPGTEESLAQADAETRRRAFALPRAVWLACAAVLVGWQAFAGRPGAALLALAALLPLLVLPGQRSSSRLGAGWLACGLAPVLGVVGLAGAYPAIAGQASRWRDRAALGALGYWWLLLAEPLADSRSGGTRLWLGQPAGTPSRGVWEASLGAAATHVILPLLTLGVLLGALLWGVGAAVLPWLVRGRSAALDVVAVTVWSAAIAAAAPMLDSGANAHGIQASPHGAVLGAVLGGLIAVAARALRGPV